MLYSIRENRNINYVIYKNSMMCKYLRSKHFVLYIDKNQIGVRNKWLSLSTDGFVDDRMLSKHIIYISSPYYIVPLYRFDTSIKNGTHHHIICDSWQLDFSTCFYIACAEEGENTDKKKRPYFSGNFKYYLLIVSSHLSQEQVRNVLMKFLCLINLT